MIQLDELTRPIRHEMEEFNTRFKGAMKSRVPLLDYVTRYIIKRKGKQMRPMFVFYSAKLLGNVSDSTYIAASLIELLHTATLVHDDVVDNANYRRGFFSINALWKNKIAVLVGDYLLSKGLLIALDNNEFKILQIVSESVKQMSEGELLQIEKARRLDITEEIYFDIITKKTASLIASCCACGAASVSKDETLIQKMKEFGQTVGIAFQLKDDLFDYDSANKTGKPSGIDIRDQKMTLPLIYLLNHSTSFQKRKIIFNIKHNHKKEHVVNEIYKAVEKSGGIEYTRNKMNEYQEKAYCILNEFPDNQWKKLLKNLVDYTIERQK